MTNWIQFIKTIEGEEVINVTEKSKVIVSSCFNFCDASVQESVAAFLLSDEDEVLLEFNGEETVVLRREREKDESKK